MSSSGITVSSALKILYSTAQLPCSSRSTLSRAKIMRDEAPCSNDSQKKTTKKPKITTVSILSRTMRV